MLNRLPTPTQLPTLNTMIDDIGRPHPAKTAKALGVSLRSLQRWIKLDRAPRPVELALYWLTSNGHHAVHCEAHNDAVMHAGMARCLREQIAHLEAQLEHLGRIGDFGAANDPADTVRSPRPSLAEPQSSVETIAPAPRKRSCPTVQKTGETKQPRGFHRG
ncbi:hypothetical protein BH11PSE9_BH11PSE9_21050 [soil metagenome]